MFRTFMTIVLAVAMAGCISTPNTKALVTPIGGMGIHFFAPQKDPNRLPPPDAQRVAQIAANQQACSQDDSCSRNQ
jgi:hypothetical protein